MATVLVVDDDQPSRDIFAEFLLDDGHDVVTAASADEAESIVGQRAIDVALIDVYMPGRNGVDLIRALHQSRPTLPVIATSAAWIDHPPRDVAVDSLHAALASGAAAALSKPTDPDDLVEAVRRLSR